ncbi:MAG: hypothetical protein AAB441_02985 [Patescibacteria group bacterium]
MTFFIINIYSKTGNLKNNLCTSFLTRNKIICQTLGCGWTSFIGIPENPPSEGCVFINGEPQGFLK